MRKRFFVGADRFHGRGSLHVIALAGGVGATSGWCINETGPGESLRPVPELLSQLKARGYAIVTGPMVTAVLLDLLVSMIAPSGSSEAVTK